MALETAYSLPEQRGHARPFPREADTVVIGGGIVGAAVAYGLARLGRSPLLLDEGDVALRASRANFALVWVQSKGSGMPEYAAWTRASADRWPVLAVSLADDAGIDVALQQPGGFTLCLSDAELRRRSDAMHRLHNQAEQSRTPYQVLDDAETRHRLPAVGPEVVGSIFCPLDGHVNSLRLFRALHAAGTRRGVDYRPNRIVERIEPRPDGFRLAGDWGTLTARTVVLAAGLGNARLAPAVGLHVPVVPSKGQVIVTEKAAPFLHHPTVTVRQTDEGGVMIGDSQEDLGFGTGVTNPVVSLMAERATRMFPRLADLNVVRTWSALRVMSPDGFPIYDQSPTAPGAFVVTCHSGVTLAANHALEVAAGIAAGTLPDRLAPFAARRFDVPQAA